MKEFFIHRPAILNCNCNNAVQKKYSPPDVDTVVGFATCKIF
jgi:hypothetical protein